MPRYRVRLGQALAHQGAILGEGACVELPRQVADDPAVNALVEEVDASGALVPPAPVDDLERFKAHERVSILRDRLAAAKAVVDGLQTQLAEEERRLREAVDAMRPPASTGKPRANTPDLMTSGGTPA